MPNDHVSFDCHLHHLVIWSFGHLIYNNDDHDFDHLNSHATSFSFQIIMGKDPHPFRPYFELITNPNNKSNKFAICLCCIEEYTRNVAITKKECYVINKAKSCHDHLKQCENFKKRYNESEYTEILVLNNKRKGKFDIILQNMI